jgi:transcription elongation factor Elf1
MVEEIRMVTKTREDRIAVACADCPNCGKENVVARASSARSEFTSKAERTIPCKQCRKVFKVLEDTLQIRRHPREVINAEYGTALPWID